VSKVDEIANLAEDSDERLADVMARGIEDALRRHRAHEVPVAAWDWERDCVRLIPPDEVSPPLDAAELTTDVLDS
jgi:hypothetical protein